MRLSEDPAFLKLLGKYAEANYKLGSNENKGRPQPGDIKEVERTRNVLFAYVDTGATP
jgi:hypothetical protein